MSASNQPLIHATLVWRPLFVAGLIVVFLLLALTAGAVAASLYQPTPPPVTPVAPVTPIPTTPAAIPYAVTCTCSADLFACSSFPFWSAAQACFNQCRIEAGFDIHGLDEDGDGVACELAPAGPSPFTLPTLPTPAVTPTVATTATLTATSAITPSAPLSNSRPITASAPGDATVTQLPAYAEAGATPAPAASMAGLPFVLSGAVVRLALSAFVVLVAAGVITWLRRRPRASTRDDAPPTV